MVADGAAVAGHLEVTAIIPSRESPAAGEGEAALRAGSPGDALKAVAFEVAADVTRAKTAGTINKITQGAMGEFT